MRRLLRRIGTGALAGVLAVALATPLAAAAPPEDAVGDVAPAKGDLVSATYQARFTDILLTGFKPRVTTRQGSNPLTSAGWRSPGAGLRILIDTDPGHTGPERSVLLHTVAAEAGEGAPVFVADVVDRSGEVPAPVPCGAVPTFTPPNVYKVNLPAECLPVDAVSVRARFVMRWDPPPVGGPVSVDRSPDLGWGPTLVAPPAP
ncbi:MAG: hypothetical protein KDB35_11710 [Acidimicrobiales bacterium]|nr:hypothetical protein [Acidimicrobiales bacterium]MCB1016744.1 hypothetical protein [Acidimicrobiales bacterium]MCB9372384.1 hypothetical protein [Microthrixaceae bacterium]